jgi:tRNA pseudouridine32 synthase/23S rRNA pseudouridine746 synthase
MLPPGEWTTILDFLAQQFPRIPRAEWIERMSRGDVVDAQANAITPLTAYRARDKVFYYRHIVDEPHIPFHETVVFQDDLIVVADKPHFLPVMPAGRYVQQTLLVRLKQKLGINSLVPLHRIDRDTAGLVLFAVQPQTRDRYAALFRERQVHKVYEAVAPTSKHLDLPLIYRSRLVAGTPFMQMREASGEPNAETKIEAIDTRNEFTRYRLSPVTGRKHQLRAQLSALGIPILNDRIYPVLQRQEEETYDKPLQLLAQSLEFIDPVSGQRREFASARQLSWT